MNQKTFEELINNSRLLNKDTISEFEQLLKEYPFCQTFHLLYTKNLYLQKHIRYNQQLKVAAAVAGDRIRLKHYIEDTNFVANAEKEQSAVEIPSVSNKEIESEIIGALMQTEPTNSIPEKEKTYDELSTPSLTDFTPKLRSRVNIRQQEDVKSKPVEWDTESESILLSTLDAEVSREEKKKAIIALINKKFAERIAATEDVVSEKMSEETGSVKPQETKPEITSSVSETGEEQMDLIESTANMTLVSAPIEDLSFDSIHENDNLEYLEGFSVSSELQPKDEQAQDSEKSEKKEATTSKDLIEKFLRDAPRMPRPKKEFYNPVNLAARSIEENEDFYTETYASICLKQGNASKAIKIYEKLSLKFPEKSSYFAGLIEKINKEQNI